MRTKDKIFVVILVLYIMFMVCVLVYNIAYYKGYSVGWDKSSEMDKKFEHSCFGGMR